MSKGRYVATWIDKIADVDTKDGCSGQGRCVLAEQINVDADTLPGLLKKLGERYGYDDPYWFAPDEGQYISFNRYEDIDANELTPDQHKDYLEKGKPVYLCDYTFGIEYQLCRDVTEGELRDAVQQIGATCD